MAETNKNLWAPWRMEYIAALDAGDAADQGCFLCRYWASPEEDRKNHVVWRGPRTLAVLNRFPYTNGHMMISSGQHVGELSELDDSVLTEMTRMSRDAVRLLQESIKPQGFNIGINLGRCAGAGLPDHIHTHIVPRWSGDTNYMAIVGDVRVVPQALEALYNLLSERAIQLGLSS